MAYHRYHKVDTKIVRIFNTYGPRMRLKDGRVVPAFIGEALRNEPISVFGDGSQTRSFCYCSDLIDGIYKLSQSDFHEPVNIGNPNELTIKEFAERIIRITGSTSKLTFQPLPTDDPKQRRPDITRALAAARLETGGRPRKGTHRNHRLVQAARAVTACSRPGSDSFRRAQSRPAISSARKATAAAPYCEGSGSGVMLKESSPTNPTFTPEGS